MAKCSATDADNGKAARGRAARTGGGGGVTCEVYNETVSAHKPMMPFLSACARNLTHPARPGFTRICPGCHCRNFVSNGSGWRCGCCSTVGGMVGGFPSAWKRLRSCSMRPEVVELLGREREPRRQQKQRPAPVRLQGREIKFID